MKSIFVRDLCMNIEIESICRLRTSLITRFIGFHRNFVALFIRNRNFVIFA